jgi:hypothetical protein
VGRNLSSLGCSLGLPPTITMFDHRVRLVSWSSKDPLRTALQHHRCPKGTVNLTVCKQDLGVRPWSFGVKACDLPPCFHSCCSQLAMVVGWNVVAGNVKEVGDRVVHGNETLKLSR